MTDHVDVARQLLALASALLGTDPGPVTEPNPGTVDPLDVGCWLWLVTPDELATLQAIARNTDPDTGWCQLGIHKLARDVGTSADLIRDTTATMLEEQPADDTAPARPAILATRRTDRGRVDFRILSAR